jgi:hypothetical protein
VNDIDWTSPAEAALALARIVNTWRSHVERAQSSRERAAELRTTGSPPPAGVAEADWRAVPELLDAQAGEWDAAAAADAGEFRQAVAQAVDGGRLTRAQASQLTAAETLDAADLAVIALKRETF